MKSFKIGILKYNEKPLPTLNDPYLHIKISNNPLSLRRAEGKTWKEYIKGDNGSFKKGTSRGSVQRWGGENFYIRAPAKTSSPASNTTIFSFNQIGYITNFKFINNFVEYFKWQSLILVKIQFQLQSYHVLPIS